MFTCLLASAIAIGLCVIGGEQQDGTHSAAAVASTSPASNIRPESDSVKRLVATGVARSQTFRDLVGAIGRSDVRVHLQVARCGGSVPSCLLISGEATAPRILVLRIDTYGRRDIELVALLAHELQHVVEIAGAPDVVSAESLRRFYERVGRRGRDGYETREANDVFRQVLLEIR